MNLAFRGISLRQVVADDMPFLFGLFTDPCRSHLWLRGRRVYDETGFRDAWAAWTSHEIAANFIVESAGRAVGLVFDHDRSTEDGWTKAVTLLSESNVGHGCGVIATALLMDWLFALLPFRKIYHEVYGYNAPVRAMPPHSRRRKPGHADSRGRTSAARTSHPPARRCPACRCQSSAPDA